jgi:hypothetical protein
MVDASLTLKQEALRATATAAFRPSSELNVVVAREPTQGAATPDPPPWCHHQICCPRTLGRDFRGDRRSSELYKRWLLWGLRKGTAGEGPHGRRCHRSRLRPPHSGARSVSANGKANEARVQCRGGAGRGFVSPRSAASRLIKIDDCQDLWAGTGPGGQRVPRPKSLPSFSISTWAKPGRLFWVFGPNSVK